MISSNEELTLNNDEAITPEQAVELLATYHRTGSAITYGLCNKLFLIAGIKRNDPYIVLGDNATDEEKKQAQEQLRSMTDETLIRI